MPNQSLNVVMPNQSLNIVMPNQSLNVSMPNNQSLLVVMLNQSLNVVVPNQSLNVIMPNQSLNVAMPNQSLNVVMLNQSLNVVISRIRVSLESVTDVYWPSLVQGNSRHAEKIRRCQDGELLFLFSCIANVVLIEIASFILFDMRINVDSYLGNRSLNVLRVIIYNLLR